MVGTSGMVPARNKAFVGQEKKKEKEKEKKKDTLSSRRTQKPYQVIKVKSIVFLGNFFVWTILTGRVMEV